MTEKRFHYDWKTGRFKDTQSNSCATSNMRVLETQINNACFNYEKKIKKLEKENKELKVTTMEMEDYLARMEEENKELEKQLRREETDKKRLMSYLMRYKGFGFDEIVDDYFNEPYYDNWWEDGFYERCWDEYTETENR